MLIDCILFKDEIDLLEIRLHELDEIVDKFVILESNLTYQSHERKFFLADKLGRFEQFFDKINYCQIKPPCHHIPWINEYYHRNTLLECLPKNLDKDDIVIFSDADEIPKCSVVKEAIKTFDKRAVLQMDFCNYYFNVFVKDIEWLGSFMVRGSELDFGEYKEVAKMFPEFGIQSLRRDRGSFLKIKNAGWHYSYCGGAAAVKQKLESFSHKELNTEDIKNTISDNLNKLKSINQLDWDLEIRKNCDIPEYCKQNLDKFRKYFVSPYPNEFGDLSMRTIDDWPDDSGLPERCPNENLVH